MGARNQILGWTWGSLNTLAGLLVALLTGCKYHSTVSSLLVFSAQRDSWLHRKIFVERKLAGFCWGCVVVVRAPVFGDSVRLIGHEARHAMQSAWLGPIFPLAYLAAGLYAKLHGLDAYADNWFERDARRHSDLVWAKFLRSRATWKWRDEIF